MRGLECKGCSEKDDYVKMTYDNQHLPIVPKEPPVNPSTGELPPDGSKIDPKELEELMRKMKSNGFGNSRFFSPSDLEGLSPEEMADKVLFASTVYGQGSAIRLISIVFVLTDQRKALLFSEVEVEQE